MDFRKYMHVERLGSDEVVGLLNGECYVFPKVDGTNASVWLDDGEIKAGSRNRELTLDRDNAGFYAWVLDREDQFMDLLSEYPSWRLYGEWLVPHTLRTYRKDAWRNLYIFDVYDESMGGYLSYDEYDSVLQEFGFTAIAPLEIVKNPSEEHLVKLLDRNTYLIEDGNGPGEGVVIKRYGFANEWGDTVWGKIVRNEFKERNLKVFGTPTVAMKAQLEQQIAIEYVTRGRVTKTMEKMRESGPVTRRRIPELFGRIWHEIIDDEMFEIVKSNKRPAIDFGRFYNAIIEQVKTNCPELFG